MKRLLMITTMLATLSGVAAAAPAYIDGTPMAAQGISGVRDCRSSDKWTVPFITWGADEVTLQANGGLRTASSSIFGKRGLDITLQRQDDFLKQVRAYLNCDSAFLRVTVGMGMQASDITEADPRTKLVAIYQHSWSAGGDVLVVRSDIHQPSDLRGKTIVVQRYGPHVDYILKILSDAGLSPSDVKIRFVNDLTGDGSTPAEALRTDGSVSAAMVISPDAAVLTSGSVGTGAEKSVKGARALFSTKTANRIITDVYFVRSDFYNANKDRLMLFVQGLLEAEEQTRAMARSKGSDWSALMKLSAKVMLDDDKFSKDAEGMWTDAETTGRQGNLKFFTVHNDPTSFINVAGDASTVLQKAGYVALSHRLAMADWDWNKLTNLTSVAPEASRFDEKEVGRLVGKMHATGNIDNNTLFAVDVHFKPKQSDFPPSDYATDFEQIATLARRYGGAVITVEGHADPMVYLQALRTMEKTGTVNRVLLVRQAAAGRNLSVQRAVSVRDAVIAAAKEKGISLDSSQFDIVGMGYDDPVTGMCGDRPCEPKSEQEFFSNMVVKFRLVNVDAEASAFVPIR
jgi:outer membrane protein OmpA-like peptidoglycan-associated protein